MGYSGYIFDLEYYLNVADKFYLDGFSLVRGEPSAVGYLYPLLLGLSHYVDLQLGHDIYLFRLMSSVLYGSAVVLLVYTYKNLFFIKKENNVKYTCLGCSAIILMLYLFYRGIIFFPLSDLFALSLAIISGCFAARYVDENTSTWWTVGSGFFAYLAYTTRSVYIVTLIGTLVFFFVDQKKEWKKKAEVLVGYLLGIIIAAVPWIYINYCYSNSITILVNNENRYANQLFWGLEYTRYEAFTGTDQNIQKGGVRFVNETGRTLINIYSQKKSNIYTVWGYLKLCVSYPVEVASIVGQHIVNALFPLFPEQYTGDLHKGRLLNGIMGVGYWYLFMLVTRWRIKTKKYTFCQINWLVLMISPSIITIPGAGEHRFYLLLYIMACVAMVFTLLESTFWAYLRDRVVIIIVGGVIFTLITFTVETGVLASCEYFPILWVNTP